MPRCEMIFNINSLDCDFQRSYFNQYFVITTSLHTKQILLRKHHPLQVSLATSCR